MKVFLSWSGELSHKVACSFREWLPSVIQAIVPYVSSEDIDKGARWSTDIANELADSSFGILCVTRENLAAPWIHFEAGALSKSMDKANVSPFLFGVKRSEVQGPLLQFQSTVFEKDDIYKLLKSLNQRLKEGERLKEDALKKALDVWWPQLKTALEALDTTNSPGSVVRKSAGQQPEILEELLELVRRQQRLLASPELLLPPEYLASVLGRGTSRTTKDDKRDRVLEKLHADIIDIKDKARALTERNVELKELKELSVSISKLHSNFHEVLAGPARRRLRPPEISFTAVEKG